MIHIIVGVSSLWTLKALISRNVGVGIMNIKVRIRSLNANVAQKYLSPSLFCTFLFFCISFYGVLGESSIIVPNVLPFKAVLDFPKALLREVRGVQPV